MNARAVLALALTLIAQSARADAADRIAALERRVAELEARAETAEARARDAEASGAVAPPREDGAPSFTLSGSARFGWYDGGADSDTHDFGARVRDARIFLDAELAEDVRLGATPLVRNIGFSFEWNLVRRGELTNDFGELYVDLQGVGGSSWLNLRPGRFQVPVGETYKRYSRGEASNPFISQPLGGPWWWDEGLMVYGGPDSGTFGYVASVTNGDTPYESDGGHAMVALKLWARPLPWLYASASGMRQGETGASGGGLWLGETWATPTGAFSALPLWIDGALAPPTHKPFSSVWLAGGDVVLTPRDGVRAWLGGGRMAMRSRAGSLYDRALDYWIAELVLRGSLVSPALAPATLGLRADGIGSGDAQRGYLLATDFAGTLGYNMRRYRAVSAVVGWDLGSATTLRAEYSLRDVDLVEGAAAALGAAARDVDSFGVELGVRF